MRSWRAAKRGGTAQRFGRPQTKLRKMLLAFDRFSFRDRPFIAAHVRSNQMLVATTRAAPSDIGACCALLRRVTDGGVAGCAPGRGGAETTETRSPAARHRLETGDG
jgi:hypothetical protein